MRKSFEDFLSGKTSIQPKTQKSYFYRVDCVNGESYMVESVASNPTIEILQESVSPKIQTITKMTFVSPIQEKN